MQSAYNLSHGLGNFFADTLMFNEVRRVSPYRNNCNGIYGYQNSQIKVLVDTSQQISIYQSGISDIEAKLYGLEPHSDFTLKSWAVFIYNPSEDTLALHTELGMTFMIQEALNESGEWQPIEYWFGAYLDIDCVTNPEFYGYILIPSRYALVQKTRIYAGNFKTKIRFRLQFNDQIILSNSFRGAININQFKLPNELLDIKSSRASKLFLEN